MKKNYKSKNGFTLVELLAVIVILGILAGLSIVAVMRFIDRAREEQLASQEKVLTIAAKHYLQENRGLLPKNIGDTTRITAEVLLNNNYLTQDIQNAKKESCMTTSYVDTKKESQTKYTYEAHICEENNNGTHNTDIPTPGITIDFLDASGKSINEDISILENVTEAKFIIRYSGGERVIDEAANKYEKIAIEGYSYSILVDPSGGNNLKEEYSSGTLGANYATDIVVDRDNNLVDYIDVTGSTTVAIRATVRNVEGGVFQTIQYAGAEPNSPPPSGVKYHDSKKPECLTSRTIGEAKDDKDWINSNSDPDSERKVTVVCNDGSGSGCVRSTFTRTWSGDEAYEYDNIVIRDNAGNSQNCSVRVNVDRKRPIISIDAYPKAGSDVPLKNSSSVLTGTKTTRDSSDGTVTIKADEYTNLYNGYMNKKNYPNGVIYKVDLSDSLSIDTWTWDVNGDIDDVPSKDDLNYEKVSSSGPESAAGDCTGKKECSFYVKLFNNGYRKGVLTVKDKAGNIATSTIYADINREVPIITNIVNSSNNTWEGTWTSDSVHLDITAKKSEKTNIDIGDYYYSYDKNAEEFSVLEADADEKWVKLSGGTGLTSFTTQPWQNEISETAYIIVCDIAGNCSDIDDEFSTNIRIDRTAPTGLKLTGYKKRNSDNLETVEGENLEIINSDEWNSGWAIIIPNSATDGKGSGNIDYRVTVTGESENVIDSSQNYRNVNAEGISTVSFIACDKVNNCSMPVSFIVKLDRTGPVTPSISNPTGGNWSTVKVTTTISSDDIASGIGKYYYSYKQTSTENGNNPKNQWVEMTEGANKKSFDKEWINDMNETVYIKACDKLGNCTSNSTILRIDANPPTQPVITNPNGTNWAKKNFALSITSSDAGSGLQSYQYTYSDSANEVGDDAETQWKIDVNLAEENFTSSIISIEGNRPMYWRACDALGNCSTKSSVRIKLDKTKPTCGTITASTNNSESGVSGTIACEDSMSGCKKDSYSFGPYTTNGTIEMKDEANNTRECTIPVKVGDCSTYSTWYYYALYSPYSNNCPGDDVSWDYNFSECADPNTPSVCSSNCNGRSGDMICCVRRRRTLKTCYVIGSN